MQRERQWQRHVCFCLSIGVSRYAKRMKVGVKEDLPGFVKIYVRQAPSSENDLYANEEICNAALVSSVKMNGIQAGRKEDT